MQCTVLSQLESENILVDHDLSLPEKLFLLQQSQNLDEI